MFASISQKTMAMNLKANKLKVSVFQIAVCSLFSRHYTSIHQTNSNSGIGHGSTAVHCGISEAGSLVTSVLLICF